MILNTTDPSSEWAWQFMSAVGAAADWTLQMMQRMPLLFEL